MKNKIFYILLSFIFIAVACQEEDDYEPYNLGTEFYITSTNYTSLDDQVVIEIDNPLQNLTEVAVTHLGGMTVEEESFDPPNADLGNIALNAGEGAITLTDAQLGMTTIGWTANFQFDAEYEGTPFSRTHSISVDDPISVEDPHIKHRSDTVYHFKFAIEPASATVDGVTVETKVSVLGTYTELAEPFNAVDSIPFTGSDYTIGTDTIFVRVTGTAGSKTETTETTLLVEANSYENTESFVLDSSTVSTKAYDLIESRYVMVSEAGDSADIQLTIQTETGGYIMGFEPNNNLEFVIGTATDYTNADIVDVEENTDFSTPLTSVNEAEEGDVFIFRTRRGTEDYMYGVMQVVAVNKPQGVLDDSSIEIEYKF